MGEFAEREVAPGGGDAPVVREISGPLFEAKGWLKFLGVLLIIYGVIMIFTIVGIIICWLPIWMGLLLMKTATGVEAAQTGGDKNSLLTAMSKLKTFFTIQGILALIGIIFAVVTMIITGTTALFSGLGNF